jgi:hypothetical protein
MGLSFLSRRSLCLSLLAATLVSAVAGSSIPAVRRHLAAGPRLELPTKELNLGKARSGEIVDGFFRIINRGGQPLTYKLKATCGCSELSPTAGTIRPYGFEDVKVGIRLQNEGTKTVQVQVAETNDPGALQATVTVIARCPATFDVQPQIASFGVLRPGDRSDVRLSIRGEDGEPLSKPERVRLTSSDPSIEIERGPATPGGITASLKYRANGPPGVRYGSILLEDEGTGVAMKVAYTANVIGELSVAPKAVTLRDSPSGSAYVIVTRPDGKPVGPIVVEIDGQSRWFRVEEGNDESHRFRRLHVLSTGEPPDDSIGTFRLRLKGRSGSVAIQGDGILSHVLNRTFSL